MNHTLNSGVLKINLDRHLLFLSQQPENSVKTESDLEARVLVLEERVISCEAKLKMYEQLFGNLLEQGLKEG